MILFVEILWLCIVIGYLFYLLRDMKTIRRRSETLSDDLHSYLGGEYTYEFGKPFVPIKPVFVENLDKYVWLTHEVVKVTRQSIVQPHRIPAFESLSKIGKPIERYVTYEYAISAKLRGDDLQLIFKRI